MLRPLVLLSWIFPCLCEHLPILEGSSELVGVDGQLKLEIVQVVIQLGLRVLSEEEVSPHGLAVVQPKTLPDGNAGRLARAGVLGVQQSPVGRA